MASSKVAIQNLKGRLRLAWSWGGKQFWLSIGLPDTKPNRKAAEITARTIELDIGSKNFDPSLAKYKEPKQAESIAVVELFAQFKEWKRRKVEAGTFAKYVAFEKQIATFFKTKSAIAVSETIAEDFVEYLAKTVNLKLGTIRERIALIKACWQWGQKKKLVPENPWAEIKVSVPPQQRAQPFTQAEINSIIQRFRSDPKLKHYANYVEFKFGCGLRTGEAAALLWKHCAPQCDRIWIGETLKGNNRKAAKRNKDRTIPLTPELQQILLIRRPVDWEPNDSIFTSVEGCPIDAKNFCRRYWKPALAELGIDYRRPYNTRHTLISHGLEAGMNPLAIAALTGHDVRTLYENYAGLVNPPKLPNLLPAFDPVFDADSQGDLPSID